MKKSEVIKTLLASYYFQEGSCSNDRVVSKALKIIETFEQDEKAENDCIKIDPDEIRKNAGRRLE
jgi:hypothetical protein